MSYGIIKYKYTTGRSYRYCINGDTGKYVPAQTGNRDTGICTVIQAQTGKPVYQKTVTKRSYDMYWYYGITVCTGIIDSTYRAIGDLL